MEFDSPNFWYKSWIFEWSYSKEQKEADQQTKGKPRKGRSGGVNVSASGSCAYARETGCGVLLFPSQTLETFGQCTCAVWRPAQSSSASRAVVAPVPAKQGMAICLLIHQLETFGQCTCAVWRPAQSRRKSRLTRPSLKFGFASSVVSGLAVTMLNVKSI